MLEIEPPKSVYEDIAYGNISSSTSSESCTSQKAERKRHNASSETNDITGITTQENLTRYQETYYTVYYLKDSNVVKEIFFVENVTIIEPILARPKLEFVLRKRPRHKKYIKMFPTEIGELGQGFQCEPMPQNIKMPYLQCTN